MSLTSDSRLWLATHLLYPNSSQAFDVYQSILSQIDDSFKKNNIGFVFFKLNQIVLKIPAVNSNKSFHVFENQNTDKWQAIYKSSQKEQIVIFVGYFIFELSLKEISEFLKISYEKTFFAFQQVFKKTIVRNINSQTDHKISLKKYNQEKVSFLFTQESLIDYCLKNLSQQDVIKVEMGLKIYPELQFCEKQYSSIVEQMKSLLQNQQERVTKPLIQISDTLSNQKYSLQYKNIFLNNKKLISSVGLSILGVFILTFRPQWIRQISQTSRGHFIVLQEIQPKSNLDEENLDQNKKINLNELPLKIATKNDVDKQLNLNKQSGPEKNSTAVALSKVNTNKATQPLQASTTTQVEVKSAEAAESNSSHKKMGGLYRGVLVVTDINEVTSKITEKIVDMGAKKAGDVELGWRKSDKLSYYHFSLPENNIDTLKDFLTKFGSLRIQFENHPRVMPAGFKRLIIEVQESE